MLLSCRLLSKEMIGSSAFPPPDARFNRRF
jgi:hypothetical protein